MTNWLLVVIVLELIVVIFGLYDIWKAIIQDPTERN